MRVAPRLQSALRRGIYPLAVLPVDTACLLLLILRQPVRATRLQMSLDRISRRSTAPSRDRRETSSSGHLLLRLPADIVAFLVAGYVWLLLPMNWAYPLRASTNASGSTDDWGGPTLAGAWAALAIP
jgi:hypothetical protein